ncbi:hypothetical protein GCM10008915_24710 [Bifidobacterium pullorum subsp. gallinarum]
MGRAQGMAKHRKLKPAASVGRADAIRVPSLVSESGDSYVLAPMIALTTKESPDSGTRWGGRAPL